MQSSDDWKVIFVDDASTDNSLEIAKCWQIRRADKFVLLSNKIRGYKTVGFLRALEYIPLNEIVAELDADDTLFTNSVVQELNELHKKYDLVYTQHATSNYSSRTWEAWRSTELPVNWTRHFPSREKVWDQRNFPGHLRTFKRHLFELIDRAVLWYQGEPLKVAFDLVYYTCLLEMVPKEKISFYDKICYHYKVREKNDQFIEDDLLEADNREHMKHWCQTEIDKWLKSLPACQRLTEYAEL
jgi:glycosyltransferase involved in cell wall biosynthesis